MFDLGSDLAQSKNVAHKNPDVVTRLQKQAEIIRAELSDIGTSGSDQKKIKLSQPQER